MTKSNKLIYFKINSLIYIAGCNVKSKKYTNATGLTIYKVNKDGSEEHYTYDKNGNLTKIERDSDNDIIYEYDEKGRLIKTIELNQT